MSEFFHSNVGIVVEGAIGIFALVQSKTPKMPVYSRVQLVLGVIVTSFAVCNLVLLSK